MAVELGCRQCEAPLVDNFGREDNEALCGTVQDTKYNERGSAGSVMIVASEGGGGVVEFVSDNCQLPLVGGL